MIQKLFNNIIYIPNKILNPIKIKYPEIHKKFQEHGFINYEKNEKINHLVDLITKDLSKQNLSLIINEAIKKNPKKYSLNIYSYLNDKTKKKIEENLSNDNEIEIIQSLLGYRSKLREVSLLLNFYNKHTVKAEGPKMFHRDSDTLQDQVKMQILINDIDENNGMFYFVSKKYIKQIDSIKPTKERQNMDLNNRWRIEDDQIVKASNNNISMLKGKKGETILIDTSGVYHKGGYIKDEGKYRILLLAVYTPTYSLSNWNKSNFVILKFLQNKLTSLKYKIQNKLTH